MNMYPSMIQSNFLDNKYTRWYFAIIEKAKQSQLPDYFETHHIIPRSMGGINSKSNFVRLSARQHFVCHLLLVKMTTGRDHYKMICAAHHMSICHRRGLYNITSSTYEMLKRMRSDSMKGSLNPMYGKHFVWSQESRTLLSKSLRSSEAFHACHNDEWRKHVSEAQSRTVIVINAHTNEVFGEWANCSRAAEALGCTRANIKAAIRNGAYIGSKLKALNHIKHWIRWKDDTTAQPKENLEDLHQKRSKAVCEGWKKRRST